jgi:kumamolisin
VNPEEHATVTIVPANPAAIPAIIAFATENHLTTSIEHGFVKAAGRLEDLQAAFDTQLSSAVTDTGRPFRHRVGPVRIPAHLLNAITAVLGLDNREQARPRLRQVSAGVTPNAFTPPQVASLYQFPAGDGAGRTIDVIELGGGFSSVDLQRAGLDPSLVTAVSVDGASNSYTGDPNGPDGEVALDTQVIGGIAPKARQRVFFAPNTDAGFIDAVAASLHATPPPDAISISWGMAESNWTPQARNVMNDLFAQLVAKGIPVLAASGDGGSADGTGSDVTDFPASAPHATGCGGTILAGGGTITSEVAWPGSGGGVSKVFPTPDFQSGLGLSGRGVPDISGNAAPESGYTVFVGSISPISVGGTSAVAPLWAGLTALLVDALGHAVGDLNAQLYPLIGTTALRDITSGNNGDFSAKFGWDAVTGCGTPVGQKLLELLGQPVSGLVDRSVRYYGTPDAAAPPTACVVPGLGVHDIAYCDTSGDLHDLWRDAQGGTGTANATEIAVNVVNGAPKATGTPFFYVDTTRNTEILLYRDKDHGGVVRSLYWSTGDVGADNLSGIAGAPNATGDPVGYYVPGTDTHHVIYRDSNGDLHELNAVGVTPIQYGGNLTGAISAPKAAGDPTAYANAAGSNVVVYRSKDNGEILSVYWSEGPSGPDRLSVVAGTPPAAGDPFAYYTAYNKTVQIVYVAQDKHIYELYAADTDTITGWDITPPDAPDATGNLAAYYSAGTNTKHVFYRSDDQQLHEIWWVPGGGTPAHVNLSLRFGAPPAADRPAAFTVEGPNTQHVAYRGTNNHIYEVIWFPGRPESARRPSSESSDKRETDRVMAE